MKNAMVSVIAVVLFLVLLLVGLYFYGFRRATKLPDNRPEVFIKSPPSPRGKVVVCAGDSITHGRVSVNYVDMLAARYAGKGYSFVNAGINAELAWNLLQRADDIVRCDPDFITVLIGTNDANSTLSDTLAKRQMREMKLPRRPDAEWYRENLRELCTLLKTRTRAKVALLSLPPIGEEPDSEAFRRAAEYSLIVKEEARRAGFVYLPLHEEMSEHITRAGLQPRVLYVPGNELPMYIALAKRFLLGRSFDEIAEENGFAVLTDLLHLNSKGAGMAAELIGSFLEEVGR